MHLTMRPMRVLHSTAVAGTTTCSSSIAMRQPKTELAGDRSRRALGAAGVFEDPLTTILRRVKNSLQRIRAGSAPRFPTERPSLGSTERRRAYTLATETEEVTMTLKVSRVDLWTASIDDRAGGAADRLEPLSKAGANFEFVFSRRTPEQPGTGMLFVTPVKGAKVIQAAQAAGFAKPHNIHSVRIEGANKPGVTAMVARALANG